MATKITRATQKLFGSTATANQMATYGSYAAGTPARFSGTTITPALIQSLANYLQGWFGAVVGANAPTIEDMNSLCYLFAYQLGYILQTGIPEWDAGTSYFIGSIAQDGTGIAYVSLTDNNLNNALTVAANWKPFGGGSTNIVEIDPSTQSPYTITSADLGKTFWVKSNNAAMSFIFAAATKNFNFTIVDRDGNFGTNNCTFTPNGTDVIEGLNAVFTARANFGSWRLGALVGAWRFQ